MRRLAMLIGVLLLPSTGAAQRPADTTGLIPAYQLTPKSPALAALLEAAAPRLGFRYAGETDKGKGAVLLSGVGGGLMAFGLLYALNSTDDDLELSKGDSNLAGNALVAGSLLYVAGRVWGVASVYAAVSETNARIAAPVPLVPGWSGSLRVQVGVSLALEGSR